ncbi:hypothetical protein B0T21DRAFT_406874 [Apiosordaria backusii]|uniref:Uncharacterized protein n=1 Tax=Apiosordaria backusii TaxID=314023 RepID=A0AA40K705_9PEZI|nr:hypothetical protein B0T21DRAFT_406874 [Apiosordaria backusii]
MLGQPPAAYSVLDWFHITYMWKEKLSQVGLFYFGFDLNETVRLYLNPGGHKTIIGNGEGFNFNDSRLGVRVPHPPSTPTSAGASAKPSPISGGSEARVAPAAILKALKRLDWAKSAAVSSTTVNLPISQHGLGDDALGDLAAHNQDFNELLALGHMEEDRINLAALEAREADLNGRETELAERKAALDEREELLKAGEDGLEQQEEENMAYAAKQSSGGYFSKGKRKAGGEDGVAASITR